MDLQNNTKMTQIPERDAESGLQHEPVNVLLAFYAEPRGLEGSTVYAAVLSDQGLAVSSVQDLSKKVEQEALAALKQSPTALAAALVVDRLFEHLATQLFYKDRWQGKFTRRFSGSGMSPFNGR